MDMQAQPRLFDGQLVAFVVNAYRDGPQGWCVTVNYRRDLEEWSDRPADFYSELTLGEALSVIDGVVSSVDGYVR